MHSQLTFQDQFVAADKDDPAVTISIRESRRARNLILQAVPPRKVEVVVPRGTRAATVQAFVREHRDWIARASEEMLASYPDAELKPEFIDLKAIGEQLRLRFIETPSTRSSVYYRHGELQLHCNPSSGWQPLLRRWLLAQGRKVLVPWLQREAERTGLAPRKTQIRLQKTRWGSCSARGNISLNAALLLLPPELVRYLLVHELCHLTHLNHSRRYWQTVGQHEPDYRALDRRLAASWNELPAWVLATVRH